MPLLSTSEALHVSDSFLSSLYGDDIFRRWKELKDEMKFLTEREYVSWLIDVANHYKREDESQQVEFRQNHDTIKKERDASQEETIDVVHETSISRISTNTKPDTSTKYETSQQDELKDVESQSEYYADEDGQYLTQHGEAVNDTLVCDEYSGQEEITVSDDDDNMDLPEVVNVSEMERCSAAAAGGGGAGSSLAASGSSSSSSSPLTCPHCSYTSKYNNGNLQRHILAMHQRGAAHACNYCQYQCVQKAHLQAHLITRHGFRSKYSCTSCGKYFVTPKTLHQHSQSCLAAVRSKYDLLTHARPPRTGFVHIM